MKRHSVLAATFLALLTAAPVFALQPGEVVLLVNKNVPESRQIADYYAKKRGVPAENVLEFDLPAQEDMNRSVYNEKLVAVLRDKLKDRKDKVKCLLSMYGVPLRVGPQAPTAEEAAQADKIEKEKEPLRKAAAAARERMKELGEPAKNKPDSPEGKEYAAKRKEAEDAEEKVRRLEREKKWALRQDSACAVDSELSMLWHDGYELRQWQVNLLYFQVTDKMRQAKPPMVMTCRLEAPTVELMKRMVDDAMAVEAKGLKGKAYLDARGIGWTLKDEPSGTGYGGYDESLREAAKLLEKEGKLDVTLDNKGELFPVGSCPDCALYCGWYSHANFVDCCKFVPGAVAYHIASSEAVTLRNPKAKYWCVNQLQQGACATIGPVAEPYTLGFPKPAEFFGFLATGEYTLAESYWKSQTFTSWMMVLVGDPLYHPYGKTPLLKAEKVKSSPEGARLPFRRD